MSLSQYLNRLVGENKEPFYQVVPFIAEFWKTVSNLPFIILGTYYLSTLHLIDELKIVYILLIFAGICSGFHHAVNGVCTCGKKEITWTLIVDWIPILISTIYVIVTNIISEFSITTWICVGLSILWLLIDNVFSPLKYWGHCIWHIIIAFSLANGYMDYYKKMHKY